MYEIFSKCAYVPFGRLLASVKGICYFRLLSSLHIHNFTHFSLYLSACMKRLCNHLRKIRHFYFRHNDYYIGIPSSNVNRKIHTADMLLNCFQQKSFFFSVATRVYEVRSTTRKTVFKMKLKTKMKKTVSEQAKKTISNSFAKKSEIKRKK